MFPSQFLFLEIHYVKCKPAMQPQDRPVVAQMRSLVRAQNNDRSMDNVRPDWGFDRSNVRLAGHVDRTRWLVTFSDPFKT